MPDLSLPELLPMPVPPDAFDRAYARGRRQRRGKWTLLAAGPSLALVTGVVALALPVGVDGAHGRLAVIPAASPDVRSSATSSPAVPASSPAPRHYDAPGAVVEAARHLSQYSVRTHAPATAVWVRTTWGRWWALEQQVTPTRDGNVPVYVVQLRSEQPLVCLSCKGMGIFTGRYATVVFPVDGVSNVNEFTLGNGPVGVANLPGARVLGHDF